MRSPAELEEFGRRADAVYHRSVQPHLTPEDEGKFLALDVNTGDFEIDDDDAVAEDRLLARHPHADGWLVRVGQEAAYDLLSTG